MRERTSLEELQLQGSPNLRRAQKRDAAEANAQFAEETRTEVEKLDELIANAMSACRRGQTFRGKPNPAFQNLSKLIKARESLTKGKRPKRSSTELLADVDKMLASAPEVN